MVSAAKIKKYGVRIGLDIVNVASAEPFPEYVKTVLDRIGNGLIPPESQHVEDIFKNVEFYSDPENSLSQARSIISLGMRYLLNDKADHTRHGVPCGRIGRHLWRDFYGELWEKKARLVNFLERQGIRCSKEAYLPHKLVAKRAGAGFYGKNCLIQNKNYGSWIRKRFPNPRKKWGISPALIPLLDISIEEFEQSFSDFEFYKKEPKFLQRNAIVSLGNTGDPVSLPVLSKMLKNQESMIRAHAAWAIGRIGGSKAKRLLRDAFRKEKDVDVRKEIDSGLQILS